MKNYELPMSERLWRNKARLLLRKVLIDFRHGSEGDYMQSEQHKKDAGSNDTYWNGDDQGKLLNEIDRFLNSKSILNKQD